MKGKVKKGVAVGAKRPVSPSYVRREDWKSKAVSLYIQGHSQETVKELMKDLTGGHSFSRNTIAKYIQESVDDWKATKNEIVDSWKAIELERINRLEATYWDAWENSKNVLKTNTIKKTKGDTGTLSIAERQDQERQSQGEPRFLQGIQWCIEQRCKLLGMEVPVPQLTINNTNTNTAVSANVSVTNRTVVFMGRTIRTSQELTSTDEDN